MRFFSLPSLISSFFGVGKFPFAPGTAGSFIATFLVALIFYQPHFVMMEGVEYFSMGGGYINPKYIVYILCLLSVLIHIIGVWAAEKYSKGKNIEDPKEVVIDEVAGIFTSFSLIAIGYAGLLMINEKEFVLYLMLSPYAFIAVFILFRIFDIIKPWHVGRADRNLKGGYGIMMDDQIAGVYTAITFFIIFFILKYSGLLENLIRVE